MAISLVKGQTINLEKDRFDLSNVTIGLGWDVKKKNPPGFIASLFQPKDKEEDYDLDAIAFLLDSSGKVSNRGNSKLEGGDVIFFNNLRHSSGNIYHTGDNRTGDGDGDDEQIVIKLNSIDTKYQKIVFMVSIYKGIEKKQHFGLLENAFIRAVDAKGQEMARYDLSSDGSFDNMRTMIFGEVYRHNQGWKFRAVGTPYESDRFVEVMKDCF